MARFVSQVVISADIGSCLSKNIVGFFGNFVFFFFCSMITLFFHGCKCCYFRSGNYYRQQLEDQEKKKIENNMKFVFA